MFSKFFKKNKNYLDSKSKHDLLHNVYVLYAIFIIAIADIFYILQVKDYYSAFIFISVGILISFFSKNMVVILCISIIVTHILKYGSNWKEGFESSSDISEIEASEITGETEGESTGEEIEEEHGETAGQHEETESQLDQKNVMTKLGKIKKMKKLKTMESTTNPENITKLLEKQTLLLDKMQEYKPLLNSIQNISKNLGLSTTAPPQKE